MYENSFGTARLCIALFKHIPGTILWFKRWRQHSLLAHLFGRRRRRIASLSLMQNVQMVAAFLVRDQGLKTVFVTGSDKM